MHELHEIVLPRICDYRLDIVMETLLYEDLSYATVGAALEVHRTLGPGFLEVVYERALDHELTIRKIPFERQISLLVKYKDLSIGRFRVDFVVDGKIILEIKAASTICPAFISQAHHYLAATGLRLAILLNFGAESLQVRRVIR